MRFQRVPDAAGDDEEDFSEVPLATDANSDDEVDVSLMPDDEDGSGEDAWRARGSAALPAKKGGYSAVTMPEPGDGPPGPLPSPEEHASFFSKMLFQWIKPLLRLGNERPLEFGDLYALSSRDCSTGVHDAFSRAYRGGARSLPRAFISAFGRPFFEAGVFKLVHDVCLILGPLLLNAIIHFLEDPDEPVSTGLEYVLALFVANVVQSLCLRAYFHRAYRAGMRLRSAAVTAVYRKSLRLSSESRALKSTGEITNLMSVDAQRLQDLTPYLHAIWYSLVQILAAMWLLWAQVGVSSLGGVSVILVMIPVSGMVARLMKKLQTVLMGVKDQRIKVINEVMGGIKVIKLQAWEESFLDKITRLRGEEMRHFRRFVLVRAVSSALWTSTPLFVGIATFVMYSMLGNDLDVATALTSLALFNILRFPLTMFPNVINNLVEASVSVKRLHEFLSLPEMQPVGTGGLRDVGCTVQGADFRWAALKSASSSSSSSSSGEADADDDQGGVEMRARRDPAEPTLCGIDFEARPGELVGVVGHVAAGKSSLLSALLGDLPKLSGNVGVRGSVAYVAQQAFIQNATLRDNILFGKEFDEERYRRTLFACALLPDLAVLPSGEMTEIGEKGINLSGGQRTRVSLARAVYQDADVYLLDDPLSAVDAHVGRHIYEHCITGMLEGKVRVFVTNAINLLASADRVYALRDGRVEESGSFDELRAAGGMFAGLMETYAEESSNSGSGDAADEVVRGSAAATAAAADEAAAQLPDAADAADGKLVLAEEREVGTVSRGVYLTWLRAGGGLRVGAFVLSLYIVAEVLVLSSSWWVSYWGEHAATSDKGVWYYLGIYIAFSAATFLLIIVRVVNLLEAGVLASNSLFRDLLERVLFAPMAFFDTTPLGRLLNRFSKDVYQTDERIPSSAMAYLNTSLHVVGIIFMIATVTPLFLVGLLPVMAVYAYAQHFYLRSSRELKRLDSIARSPVYALFSETLDGAATVRAYGGQERFTAESDSRLDRSQAAYFLIFSANCWLAVRLEFAGTAIVTLAALMVVMQRDDNLDDPYFPGMAGLAVSFALSITQSLNWSVRMASDLEANMVSVERLKEYSEMPVEAARTLPSDPDERSWPARGRIEFRDVVLRYRPGLPVVLRQLSFTVEPRDKVGIVGRTGAGKSSLVLALLRLVEIEAGSIVIDGLNIAQLGLRTLRAAVAVIPQDPVLFSGTVRKNLDPFDVYSDDELWTALERAHLKDGIEGLDAEVAEAGSNFSVGQRQLLCIARALLAHSKVFVLDEASASIDIETDQRLQEALRDNDATTLTIAHRLNTIMESDRILVMDTGAVLEYDAPQALLADSSSAFYSLAHEWEESGSGSDVEG